MAVIFDQKQRQGVARVVGMNAPVSIFTPDVTEKPGNDERIKRFLITVTANGRLRCRQRKHG
jgi:hypothetical protein